MSELKRSRSDIFEKTTQILIFATKLRDKEVITANSVCEELEITPRTACRYLEDLRIDGYLKPQKSIHADEQHQKGYVASEITKELFGVNTSKLKRAMQVIVENCKASESKPELAQWQKSAAYHQRMTIQELLDEFF